MDQAAAAIPATIGPYQIAGLLTAGVFGRVFRAWQPALERRAAIKLFSLSPEKAAEICYDVPEWRRRFVLEARILARLDHPHIIRVDDLGWHEGEPYMAMPYMEANLRAEIGADVDDSALPGPLRPHAIAPVRAIELLAQVLSALAALHAAGIVHRDVKPANLLLTRTPGGTVKLCDFGYARSPGLEEPRSDVWFGSPDYMSPEQGGAALAATDRSDVYSTGVLAWRMLTGRLPPAGALPPDLPAGLAEVVLAALQPDPARRPSAAAMLASLTRLEALRRAG